MPIYLAFSKSYVMALSYLLSDHIDANAANSRRGPGEILVHEILVESNCFKDLSAAVTLDGRDTHFGDDLDDALVNGLDVILDCLLVIQSRQKILVDHVVQRLKGQVRIDCRRAITKQQGEVMNLAWLATLYDKANLCPGALAN